MKTCKSCGEKVAIDDGKLNAAGEFVCLTCAEELDENRDPSVCPECEEISEEYADEGVCPSCGYEKSEKDEDEDSDDTDGKDA